MAIESAADRAQFVSTDDFGVAATYRSVDGVEAEVAGIFDAEHAQVFDGDGTPVDTRRLTFTCRASDLTRPRQGASLTIGADTFRVAGVRPDGTGMTELLLNEDA